MATNESKADPLAVYARYSFADDQSYQAGLSTLYASGALDDLSDETKEDLLRKSRVFYFNQAHGCDISESDAKQVEVEGVGVNRAPWQITDMVSFSADRRSAPEVPTAQAARTLTFAELQALIDQGKTDEIPNNKHIPDALNDAAPSQSSAPQRKKPWEVASQAE
ncbi:hypothetical protein H4582DRAFT_1878862 [Lactarius indigo]|nr:hypothetical protein H4582DRAFT_1831399 [Lactarius indigo]KAI9438238.1 hypothetical protein H4582DRAFT_1878862 [Lactarius indigo]